VSFQEVLAWVLTVLLSITLYVVILVVCSTSYYEYLRFPSRKTRLWFILTVSLTGSVVVPSLVTWEVLGNLPVISVLAYIVFFVLAGLYKVLYEGRFKCSEEEQRFIDGMKFSVCYGGPLNAWYDWRKKIIYVSDKLLRIFNDQELRAVYYHEEGHRKHLVIGRIGGGFTGLWLVFFSMLFTTVWAVNFRAVYVDVWTYLLLLGLLIPIACTFSLVSMLWNWLNEHEADIYSLEKTGPKPLISALIKLYIYSWLEEEGISYDKVRASLDITAETLTPHSSRHKLKHITWLLFKRSSQNALKIFEVSSLYKTPISETHPPLELRVYRLVARARTKKTFPTLKN